jgi:copper(I)-binding protein
MRATLLAAAAGLMIAAMFIPAGSARAQPVEVTDPWARATPGGAETAAAYVTLAAASKDRLTGVATPAAKQADLHAMTMDNGVMRMRPLDGLDLPAGETVTLKPGGTHIMLSGLAKPLREGDRFPLTLTFANSVPQQVTVVVKGLGAMGAPGMSMPHGDLPHMPMPMPR